jgi:hypothetical protein
MRTAVKIITEAVFYAIAAAVIIPAPTLLLAWMTSMTLSEVLFR